MIPKYNSITSKLKALFLQYRNDIIIYTEDNLTDKEFYKMLLGRLVGETCQINDIHPLGCKSTVIRLCQEDTDYSKRKLYVVDADLELITDSNPNHISRLFVLDSYCIENYLIDEEGIVEIIWEYTGKDKQQIKSALTFNNWLGEIKSSLIHLFLNFSIQRDIIIGESEEFRNKYAPILQNAYHFIDKKKKFDVLCVDRVNAHITLLKEKIKEALREKGFNDSENEYQRLISEKKERWAITNETLLRIVSGKSYLIPLLEKRLQKFTTSKSGLSIDIIKRKLARHCSLNRLEPLKIAIEN